MKDQLVSIITPCFNSSKTITQTIYSILEQTYNNWELIIIDDCSTDVSCEIVQSYVNQDPRVKLIQLKKNSGAAAARNTGIEHAKGQLIAFLDSDDYWHPEKLEEQLKYFKKYDVDVVFSGYYRFNSSGIIGKVGVPKKIINFKDLLKGNCIGNLTGIYNFKKHPEIRQRKVGAEDYLFWLEIFSKPNVKGIGGAEALAYYRVAENAQSLSSNKFRSAKWTWDIYYRHLGLGFIKSLYYFIYYIYFAFNKRI